VVRNTKIFVLFDFVSNNVGQKRFYDDEIWVVAIRQKYKIIGAYKYIKMVLMA